MQEITDTKQQQIQQQLDKERRERKRLAKMVKKLQNAHAKAQLDDADSGSGDDSDFSLESEDDEDPEPEKGAPITSLGVASPARQPRRLRLNCNQPVPVSAVDAIATQSILNSLQTGESQEMMPSAPPSLPIQPSASTEISMIQPSTPAATALPPSPTPERGTRLPLEWASETSERDRKHASNFKKEIDGLINRAVKRFAAILLPSNPFPPTDLALDWAAQAWREVCDDAGRHYEDSGPRYNRVLDIIKSRASQIRGRLRNALISDLNNTYGFKKGSEPHIQEHNRKLVRYLREGNPPRFCYKSYDTFEGCAQAPLVQNALHEAYFKRHEDPGIRFKDRFRPLPLPTLALAYTIVQYGVDLWEGGTQNTSAAFTEDAYSHPGHYDNHLKWLKDWDASNPEASRLIREDMYDGILDMSGIKPAATQSITFSERSRAAAQAELDAYLAARRRGTSG